MIKGKYCHTQFKHPRHRDQGPKSSGFLKMSGLVSRVNPTSRERPLHPLPPPVRFDALPQALRQAGVAE